MTSLRFLSLFSLGVVTLSCCLCGESQAQELRNFIRDYATDRPLTYAPTDPSLRGNVFNQHTKHHGVYYNCDGEEDKRNSPYICWKTHFEADFPERKGLRKLWKEDWSRIRQRICDGAGPCCSGCTQTSQPCQCAECSQAGSQGEMYFQDGNQQQFYAEPTIDSMQMSTTPNRNTACQCAECAAKRNRSGGGTVTRVGNVSKNRSVSNPVVMPQVSNPVSNRSRHSSTSLVSRLEQTRTSTRSLAQQPQKRNSTTVNTPTTAMRSVVASSSKDATCNCAACKIKRANRSAGLSTGTTRR